MQDELRIVSLLPSATEIVCALGLADQLRAVTYECDYPSVATTKPAITRSLLRPDMTSAEIDSAVSEQISSSAHSIYGIDRDLLAEIAPTHVVTQRLCDVCAVDFDEVQEAVATLPQPPQVLTLEPTSLTEMLDDIERVGAALGVPAEGVRLRHALEARIERVRLLVGQATSRPRVAFIEWIDPLFRGGHWNPELVRMAGGDDPLGYEGRPSTRMTWEDVRATEPEVMVIACCGFSAERARQDLPILEAQPGYADLPCVRAGRVYVVDGSAFFSRPGPRLVDSLELLAPMVHPELFAAVAAG